ncbi:DUF192 domain-containing protein [Halomonas cupida]|uniref:DUF192 domain-containing protein n=1 Tax=Halomonas cupida TaxID=44933 RepID=UPI003EF8E77A
MTTRIGIIALFLTGIAMVALVEERQSMQEVVGQLATEGGDYELALEVAHTSRQRRQGLMERPSLPANTGLLFTYDEQQPAQSGFWMFKTRFPIDIAFLDQQGRVLSMTTMPPCTRQREGCPRYPAGVPFWMALELNAGALDAMGVSVGDQLVIDL